MIDLMNNGLNGKSDYIPCPFCREIEIIRKMVNDAAAVKADSLIETLGILLSELRMYRSNDDYQSKLSAAIKRSVIKKLKENGLEMDGEIS